MRFLMLNWRDPANPKSGGAERVSLAYLEGLKDRGHEITWFANEFPGCKREVVINGIQIVRGGGSGKSILIARRWYHQQKPFNLVIDQHHGIPWFAPWWSGTNCVSYVHEVLGPIWGSFYPWPLSMLGRWQERWIHWLYRKFPFWTGSESTRRALLRHGAREVKVLHYGIDLQPLAELEKKPLQQPVRLIAVSRLAPNKRIDHAIQAVKVLLKRGVDAHLVIVGSGEMEGHLRQLASHPQLSGRIVFSGQLSEQEKDAKLRESHFLIHTSLREGWGLNVLEANAMGTPAVVYPVDGLVDATIDGETGVVTREETPESVAEEILKVLQSPEKYEQFRVKGCERTKEFHWSRVVGPACDWLEQQASAGRKAPR
jgi:glycosyltransferase involved in cell wall biosynthesis